MWIVSAILMVFAGLFHELTITVEKEVVRLKNGKYFL